jgi:putative endopeptidase
MPSLPQRLSPLRLTSPAAAARRRAGHRSALLLAASASLALFPACGGEPTAQAEPAPPAAAQAPAEPSGEAGKLDPVSSAATSTASGEAGKPVIGSWGLDLAAIDPTIKPGEDFFGYASGGWLKRTEIPADRARWGMFDELQKAAEENVRRIVSELSQSAPAAGSEARKVADFYAAFLDQAAIDKAGL